MSKVKSKIVDSILKLPIALWLFIFIIFPIILQFIISVSNVNNAIPPFTPTISIDFSNWKFQFNPNFYNFLELVRDQYMFNILINSLTTSLTTTLLSLPFAWYMAFIMQELPKKQLKITIYVLLCSILLSHAACIYSLNFILGNNVIFNNIDTENTARLEFIISYKTFPYMTLIIYVAFRNININIFKALQNHSINILANIFYIYIPLSKPGIFVACLIGMIIGGSDIFITDFIYHNKIFNSNQYMVYTITEEQDWISSSTIIILQTIYILVNIGIINRIVKLCIKF